MATGTPPRVFVDTNVLFSAVYDSRGAPAALVRLHIQSRITIVISAQVLSELVRAIRRKMPQRSRETWDLLAGAPPDVRPQPSQEELRAIEPYVNAKDTPILAAAIAARVDYIVSGDRTFLEEARQVPGAPKAVSPREMVDLLAGL